MPRRLIAAGVGIIVLGVLFLSSVFTVKEGEQAILLQLGAFVRVESRPGLHFKAPFIQNVSYFDKRVLDFEADLGEINTKDQKQTLVDTYTRYRITDALKFFQTARSVESFEARRDDAPLNAFIKSNVREVFARVDLATLLTAKRAEVMKEITKRVHDQLESFGVEVLDVRLKRIDLPQQNADAVQQRMETQRRQEAIKIRAEGDKESQRIRAEADKQVRVTRAEAEQKANILRGEGEGTAQEIYNRAFGQDKDFFEFWQCMQTVRDGLASGTTRLVGMPTPELLLQLCKNPRTGTQQTEPRRAEN
jgi:modulator of FtsH protease HflC